MNPKSIIIFKDHAIFRMFERGISREALLEVIEQGEIIEQYKDDHLIPVI